MIAALDQGTTSSRCILFTPEGRAVATAQEEHRQSYPKPGWVEHDAEEIFQKSQAVLVRALETAGVAPGEVKALGITNQRETTVVWDRKTLRPLAPAIVWQDLRTDALCKELEAAGLGPRVKATTGLPIATYFSGPKVTWLLRNDPALRARAQKGEVAFGTIDCWLLARLAGVHATDVSNASRTLLMDLRTRQWDQELLQALSIPAAMLPAIRSSSEVYGTLRGCGRWDGIPVAGVLGDQQAALAGQACFQPGMSKNTYGTGCFLLVHTGETPKPSRAGLITTVAMQLGPARPAYALEGSVAIAGALVQWLRDNLGLIREAAEIEGLAAAVEDSGGVYFVPAFSGLFAPHWRSDARGIVAGLTRFANKHHLARAALEAVCWQTRDVLDAAVADTGTQLAELRVDGGMVKNNLLLQLQADILGIPVVRAQVQETTALGAAYMAGLATGVWRTTGELERHWRADRTFTPQWSKDRREQGHAEWKKAVERSLGWA
jgi:glycerol kinase